MRVGRTPTEVAEIAVEILGGVDSAGSAALASGAATVAVRVRSTTARSPSPAARRRSTSSTSTGCAPPPTRAFANDPAGTTAYGTSVGYLPLRGWIAEHHGVDPSAGARHQRLDAGRRLPVRAARRRGRRGRRRAPDLRPHAAVAARARRRRPHGRARARRHRRRRRGDAARRRPAPEAGAHHPQLPEPRRLHAVARASASGCSSSPPSTASRSSRTTPTSRCASSGEPLPTMLSLDERESVVYASSFSKTVCPGIRVGYLVGPTALIAQIAKLATEHVHLAEHGRPVDRQRVLPLRARSSARSRPSRARCASAPDAGRGARARAARGASSPRPEGGYFMWVDAALRGSTSPSSSAGRRRARRAVRQGDRLPARGRREHAAPRLLGRDARPGRRGRDSPRRGERPSRRLTTAPVALAPSTSCSGSAMRGGGEGRRSPRRSRRRCASPCRCGRRPRRRPRRRRCQRGGPPGPARAPPP